MPASGFSLLESLADRSENGHVALGPEDSLLAGVGRGQVFHVMFRQRQGRQVVCSSKRKEIGRRTKSRVDPSVQRFGNKRRRVFLRSQSIQSIGPAAAAVEFAESASRWLRRREIVTPYCAGERRSLVGGELNEMLQSCPIALRHRHSDGATVPLLGQERVQRPQAAFLVRRPFPAATISIHRIASQNVNCSRSLRGRSSKATRGSIIHAYACVNGG